MIPVRLQLRNFMCYRENVPPLEFDGIHLAVLAGNNGNGKSAIIDAMTWALWGKARAGSIDDLIHTLASDMEVQFDFTVSGALYRVIRKRSRPKRRTGAGQSALELQVQSGDGFRVMSGNTIDETQQKIIDTLHMDYDTFSNSAYLRQGHADEFTRQPPGKRKEVLGTILGLETYDALEEKARTMARQKENERAQAEASVAEMAAELSRRPDDEAACKQAEEQLVLADGTVQEKEGNLRKLQSRRDALESEQSRAEALEAQIESNRRLAENLEQQAGEHRKAIAGYRDTIGKKADIETGHAEYTAARKLCDELSEKLRKSVVLERRRTELEKVIDKARQELARNLDRYQQEVEKLEERVKALPELRERLAATGGGMEKLEAEEKELEEQGTSLRSARERIGLLQAETARLEKEIAETAEKLDLLARHREEHADVRCPLCESELTREGLELIESKYNRERQEKTSRLEEVRGSLEQEQTVLKESDKGYTAREKELRERRSGLQGQVSVLRKDIEDRETDEARLVKGREYVAGVNGQIERREYAAAEQQELAALEKELAALGYDEEKYREAQERAERLQEKERDHRLLEEAERLIAQEEAALQRAEESVGGLRETLRQDEERRQKLTAELEALPELRRQVETAENEYRELSAARSHAQETVGAMRARLRHLDELDIKKKEREKSLSDIAREASVYKELTRAFGKSGIQALLIDMALPDIENEANRLLTRMTDNRMHVNFETQQETRAGTVRETLDIFITDELGTRDYEMFSGGEAFRINFAIRIALSRLLAKRAGAPLPTIIIDEGFGTQDSSGMEKLKEAINSIQDDFEKILVITHMDELKDAFPTRIDVVKTPEGSSITVN